MPSLDGDYAPFDGFPAWGRMAPCMRSCDSYSVGFNGCDNSGCWCNKKNLDLRMTGMTRCASADCTFANMNTQTDMDILSDIQVQYCVDHGHSPAGMALPTSVDAATTGLSNPTGTAKTTKGPSGPANTSASNNNNNGNNSNSGGLSTAVKSGIGVGVAFCVLLAILIIVLLFRRRKPAPQHYPPPPSYGPNEAFNQPPPNMAPTPYSGNGPFSPPPPIQQPVPVHAYKQQGVAINNMGDVSPVSEKAVPVAATTPKVTRKELSKSPTSPQTPHPPTTPGPLPASTAAFAQHAQGPREVQGDLPPQRHEFSNDTQITNTVSTHGMELDSSQQLIGQYPGQQPYQQSAQGYYPPQQPAHEVDGGQNSWGQRQELPAQGQQGAWGQGQGQGYQGGSQYGHPYEMPGR